jgi:hypothetical protein
MLVTQGGDIARTAREVLPWAEVFNRFAVDSRASCNADHRPTEREMEAPDRWRAS